jgi:hypothetical protein
MPVGNARRSRCDWGHQMAVQALGDSGTPLARKLGIKPGFTVVCGHEPNDYRDWLAPLPRSVVFASRVNTTTDLVHVFETRQSALAATLTGLRSPLREDATVWVSWPKKASKVATDITEDTIRDIALPMGFVDVKVCAVSEVWSGLKLVVRKSLRLGTATTRSANAAAPVSAPTAAPLFKKLNLGTHTAIHVLNAPASFESELAALSGVTVHRSVTARSTDVRFVMAFVVTQAQLDTACTTLTKACTGDAVWWMVYPKASSKKYRCEFNRDSGWPALGAEGFEPVRVVAIDADWSALRFRRVDHIKHMARAPERAISIAGKRKVTPNPG